MTSIATTNSNKDDEDSHERIKTFSMASLQLPSYNTNITFSKSLRKVRKEREQNRLFRIKSIQYDYIFVKQVLHDLNILITSDSAIKIINDKYKTERSNRKNNNHKIENNSKIKIYANLRNGLWYYPKFHGTAYFKSTDGHSHKWNFSYKRLNMNVLKSAILNHGIALIDSTRRGKCYPDSFSMTIPIWCCVLNRAKMKLLIDDDNDNKNENNDDNNNNNRKQNYVDDNIKTFDINLNTPPWILKEEKSFVEKLIDNWVEHLLKDFKMIIKPILSKLSKPLRALWISPQSKLETFIFDFNSLPFIPIICISASSIIGDETFRIRNSFPYIQGAGDDEENWANGLTPSMFWKYNKVLLNCRNLEEFEHVFLTKVKSAHNNNSLGQQQIENNLLTSKKKQNADDKMKNIEGYKLRWIKNTRICILFLKHMEDIDLHGNCIYNINLNVDTLLKKNQSNQKANNNNNNYRVNLFVFNSSIVEYKISTFAKNNLDKEQLHLKYIFVPIDCKKKGPSEKILYMENGFSIFLNFFLSFFNNINNNHEEGDVDNYFMLLPGHDISSITFAIAALGIFYDANLNLITNINAIRSDNHRINKKTFQKIYALLQMELMCHDDEKDSVVDTRLSLFQKLPRRHMKYLNEYFTSTYNGRRWYNDLKLPFLKQ